MSHIYMRTRAAYIIFRALAKRKRRGVSVNKLSKILLKNSKKHKGNPHHCSYHFMQSVLKNELVLHKLVKVKKVSAGKLRYFISKKGLADYQVIKEILNE